MKNPYIINTHSHVNTLTNTSVEDALENARNNDIITIIPSSSPEDIFDVDKFVKSHNDTYGYIGVYPEFAKDFSDNCLDNMKKIISNNPKIVGIGEIGLDYYWDKTFVDEQKQAFIRQIKLANEMNLPINVHCRDAYGDTLEILKTYNNNSTVIMHCFSGSYEFAKECIKLGMYISIGGVVTFKNAAKIKEVASNIPLEHLLLETDDPYLAPVPFRGKENQPAYVKYVCDEIANLRGVTPEVIAQTSTQNALKIFPKINSDIINI